MERDRSKELREIRAIRRCVDRLRRHLVNVGSWSHGWTLLDIDRAMSQIESAWADKVDPPIDELPAALTDGPLPISDLNQPALAAALANGWVYYYGDKAALTGGGAAQTNRTRPPGLLE